MKYTRKYILQSSHFNNQVVYDFYRKVLDKDKQLGCCESVDILLKHVLPHIHGHNFVVEVSIDSKHPPEGTDYIVDDKVITELVEKYNNVNLSVLPCFAFHGVRATAERLAEQILADIDCELRTSNQYDQMSFALSVVVEETSLISASVEGRVR
jgi:6-pyruvoyl-tetrahydropterin synthase